MSRIQEALRRLEVKHHQEQYAAQGTTGWGNRDIYPIIPEHWTQDGPTSPTGPQQVTLYSTTFLRFPTLTSTFRNLYQFLHSRK
jgi:hypothetical protein